MRSLGFDPVHDTQTAFRALCDATSRPGTVVDLGGSPADHAILATLVDHEVTAWTEDDELRTALERQGRFEVAPPADADVVHARGAPEWDVRECTRGTLVEPSEGATVVYRVAGIEQEIGESVDEAERTIVELTGPGVDGSRRVAIGLPAPEIERLAEAQSTYPRGVDAYLTTGNAAMAIPRSSELEVA